VSNEPVGTESANEGTAVPDGTPLVADPEILGLVRFDAAGLVAVVIQDAEADGVLGVAYMNEESLRLTIETGRVWYWSRSRQELWRKGDTSGDVQYARELRVDCDGDALLLRVDQCGRGNCHTGDWSCFARRIAEGPGAATSPAAAHR
jgi:phosphoribosyl-AMP cyclohydrolase